MKYQLTRPSTTPAPPNAPAARAPGSAGSRSAPPRGDDELSGRARLRGVAQRQDRSRSGGCRATRNGAPQREPARATTRSASPRTPTPPIAGSPNTTPRAPRPRADERLKPLGAFGANEYGVYDLSGNVWEWTDSCFVRYAVGPSGVEARHDNCGVRVVEGEHRTYITDFIRDARAGGCSVGKPPSHLGVRLVREDFWLSRLAQRLKHAVIGDVS